MNKRIKISWDTIWLIPLLIFAVNFILKLIYLDRRDIANDEPFTIFWAQAGLKDIFRMLPTENNPPFHFFLMHFWIKLFGISALSVRFPSLLFSSFTAVIIFLIGKRFYSIFTGISAALIFTFSTMQVYFSHEARVYPLFALLTAISLYIFLIIREKPERKQLYVFLFLTNFILIYSHYFGFFVLLIELISTLITKQRRQLIMPMFVLMSGLALSYLPVIYIFLQRFSVSTSAGTWVKAPGLGQFYGFLNLFLNSRVNMAILLLMLIIEGVFLLKRKAIIIALKNMAEETTIIIFLWFFIPYTIMFLASFKAPMFIDRYILYTSIPFYLFIAILIDSVYRVRWNATLFIYIFIIPLLFTFHLNPDNFRRMKELASLTKELKTANSLVLLAPDYADLGFTYHYNTDYFKDYANYRQHLNDDNIYPVNSLDEAKNALIKPPVSCIYIQAGNEFQDPQNAIYNYISSKYKTVKHYKVFQIYLVHKFEN
jgi:4-amino-4-deoxy-L-arabinose transferase-like glycosyltransferase